MIKWSQEPFALGKEEFLRLVHRMEAFRKVSKTKKSLHLPLVASAGLRHNEYYGHVQSEVSLVDLFEEAISKPQNF